MRKGERIDGIENDPLSTKDADYKVAMNTMPGFIRREQTVGGEKATVEPTQKSSEFVKQLLEKVKQKHEKKEEGIEEKKEEEEELPPMPAEEVETTEEKVNEEKAPVEEAENATETVEKEEKKD